MPVRGGALREGLLTVELPGRFQVLPGRPTVVLDVAHNPHAAGVLADELGAMGYHPQTFAVFGMFADKDMAASRQPCDSASTAGSSRHFPGRAAPARTQCAAAGRRGCRGGRVRIFRILPPHTPRAKESGRD